jgi:hypothetical protein
MTFVFSWTLAFHDPDWVVTDTHAGFLRRGGCLCVLCVLCVVVLFSAVEGPRRVKKVHGRAKDAARCVGLPGVHATAEMLGERRWDWLFLFFL